MDSEQINLIIMKTYYIKNTSSELITEPYWNASINPGETKGFEQKIAQRFLVLRPTEIVLVDAPKASKQGE